jgi:hypothetical protein
MAHPLVHLLRALPLVALLFALPASACPICDSPAGGQVRAGIAGDGIATGVLATLLPFAVTAGVVAVIHFGGPSRRRPGDGDRH